MSESMKHAAWQERWKKAAQDGTLVVYVLQGFFLVACLVCVVRGAQIALSPESRPVLAVSNAVLGLICWYAARLFGFRWGG